MDGSTVLTGCMQSMQAQSALSGLYTRSTCHIVLPERPLHKRMYCAASLFQTVSQNCPHCSCEQRRGTPAPIYASLPVGPHVPSLQYSVALSHACPCCIQAVVVCDHLCSDIPKAAPCVGLGVPSDINRMLSHHQAMPTICAV